MKRTLATLTTLLFALVSAYSLDLASLDALHDQKKLDAELSALKPLYSPASPEAAVAYRLVRCMQQIAVDLPASEKKEKLARFDEAISLGKAASEKAKGSANDRAKILYWYAVSVAQKGNTQGVLNSLFLVPEVKSICDSATAIDSEFGDPYYLKAKLDDAVPEIAGGNKTRMGQLYARALELMPDNIWYLTDFAVALKKRNKDAAFNKDGSKGVPASLADLEYAKQLAAKARQVLAALPSPSIEQKQKIDEMKTAGL
jgi:hypothetical protein